MIHQFKHDVPNNNDECANITYCNNNTTHTFVGNRRGGNVGLLVLVLHDDLDFLADEGRIFAGLCCVGDFGSHVVDFLGRRRNLRRLGVGLSLGHFGAARTAEDAGERPVRMEHKSLSKAIQFLPCPALAWANDKNLPHVLKRPAASSQHADGRQRVPIALLASTRLLLLVTPEPAHLWCEVGRRIP